MSDQEPTPGGTIRLYRTARREGLRAWAAAAGCSAPMLSMIERGLRRPGPELAARLAAIVEKARRGDPL